jgi:hypothetical protein
MFDAVFDPVALSDFVGLHPASRSTTEGSSDLELHAHHHATAQASSSAADAMDTQHGAAAADGGVCGLGEGRGVLRAGPSAAAGAGSRSWGGGGGALRAAAELAADTQPGGSRSHSSGAAGGAASAAAVLLHAPPPLRPLVLSGVPASLVSILSGGGNGYGSVCSP